MGTIHMILEDMKRAVYANRYRLLIAFLLVTALVMTFTNQSNVIYSSSPEYGKLNFFDNIFCLLRGIEPVAPEKIKDTQIPYIWIAIQFICAFVTLDYTHNDKQGIGREILIRSRSKFRWWISKCICNVVLILGIYVMIGIVSLVVSAINYQVAGDIHIDLVKIICDLKEHYTYSPDMIVYLLVVPVMFSVNVSIVQMAVTEFIGPIVSLIFILSIDVVSVFVNSKWLWGNWTMIVRSSICMEDGISMIWSVGGCVVIAIIGFIVGGYRFYKSDVL